jgi:hypothetical protein
MISKNREQTLKQKKCERIADGGYIMERPCIHNVYESFTRKGNLKNRPLSFIFL